MTVKTLSAPVVSQTFPEGTLDPGFTYDVRGTLADGSPFAMTQPTPTFDLQPGTYTGVVSKLGVSSQPSSPLTVVAPVTVSISVPDPGQPAVFS